MTIINKTKIEWCDSTWNPVTGCYHGCEYCYARSMARRFSNVKIEDGNNQVITLDEPYIAKNGKRQPYPYDFVPTFHKYRLGDIKRKSSGKSIFVCSMADLFGEWVPDSWIHSIFNVCEKAPQNKYLFLTKNPVRYIELAYNGELPISKNMYYGTTITSPTQSFFVSGYHKVFLSIEPILEDFSIIRRQLNWYDGKTVDWMIIGAETGNRKGKVIPEKSWIEPLVEYCDKYNVPVFMKDSLVPIMGEKNMRRQFPWEVD